MCIRDRTWIEQHLAESGLTIAQLVQTENQRQAADQVSISNSIGSLRILGAMDWRKFVETHSVVEQTLLEDPGGVYGRMDFATRDRYRHATEEIARKGNLTEGALARKAIELARAGALAGEDEHGGHVGFYLIGKGRRELEKVAEVAHSASDSLRHAANRCPLLIYLGAIALIAGVLSGSLLTRAQASGMEPWALIPLGMLALLATSQLAVALVNWLASQLVSPHPLPKMDFAEGIPEESRTLVVVPTMLTSLAGVEAPVSYTHLRAHETVLDLVCRLLL